MREVPCGGSNGLADLVQQNPEKPGDLVAEISKRLGWSRITGLW